MCILCTDIYKVFRNGIDLIILWKCVVHQDLIDNIEMSMKYFVRTSQIIVFWKSVVANNNKT